MTSMQVEKFRRWLATAIAIPLAAIAALGLMLMLLLQHESEVYKKVNHLDEVVAATGQIQEIIHRQSDLVCRHEIAGGAPQTSALSALHTTTRIRLAELQKMNRDHARNEVLLQQLNDNYLLWLGWAQQTLAGKTYGLTIPQNDAHGRLLMTQVQRTLRQLIDAEHAEREHEAEFLRHFQLRLEWAAGAVLLLECLLLLTVVRRNLQFIWHSYRALLQEQRQPPQ